MKKIATVLGLFLLLSSSCSKDEHIPQKPSMLISVADENGATVSGAIVLIYENYQDWYDAINPIDAGVTGENGEVLFENLKEVIYYFDAYYTDIYWNYPKGIYRTEEPLKRGYLKKLNVTLYKIY